MIPDSPLPGEYGYDEFGAFNCTGEQIPVHEDANSAIAFIEKCHSHQKPFFINLWMHEPHTPFHTVPKYEWRFRELESREDQIYASVLSHADDRIGQVLSTLDRLKLSDHTLVIFSSDNGPARAPQPTELTLPLELAGALVQPRVSPVVVRATSPHSLKAALASPLSPAGQAKSQRVKSTVNP